jgi:small subunit ribosomal protein S8
VAESAVICATSTSAESVSANSQTKAKSRALRNLLGNTMDHIADMITRIKNAADVRKESVVFPYSKIKHDIAAVLQKEGYLKSVTKKGKKVTKFVEVELAYDAEGAPKVNGVQRVSKFSKRMYTKAKDIRPVKYGTGMLILTTPKGILTGKEARKEKVGGEALFKIW